MPLSRWLMIVSKAIAVLPVCRSPRINSRCPRPTGIKASTTLMPVCRGTVTGARSMIAGAGRSTGKRRAAWIGPSPSTGLPTPSTTRPSSASPTGTSSTRCVRRTSAPACKPSPLSSRMTPTSCGSRLKAMPSRSPGKRTSSCDRTPGNPFNAGCPVTDKNDAAHLFGHQLRPV